MGYGPGGWMWLFWLLIIIGIVVLVVVVIRSMAGGITRTTPAAPAAGRSRARQVLDERYARGELTTEEYRERLSALGEDR